MPRRFGHPKAQKPWDRENWKTRKRRKRIGKIKEAARARRGPTRKPERGRPDRRPTG